VIGSLLSELACDCVQNLNLRNFSNIQIKYKIAVNKFTAIIAKIAKPGFLLVT